MKYLSLFSGIGGFELGIIKAYENNISREGTPQETQRFGHTSSNGDSGSDRQHNVQTSPICIGFSEIDKYAIQIYQKQFPNHKNYGDITKINVQELPDFDLLVGGFPCQAFSIAGKRKGFDDTRGTLFFDIARILKEKRPRNFILENVKGLLSHDNGRTFKTIISTLVELGYCVEWQVLNAKNFGVPQNRERVFIVGHLGGIPERKVFPIGENDKENIKSKQMGRNTVSATVSTRTGSTAGGQQFIAGTIRTYKDGSGFRKIKSGLSPTIPARAREDGNGQPVICNETRIRRLTPLECERLMGYPDGWTEGLSDTQRYKTLGNGIVSNVVAEVVKKLSTARALTYKTNFDTIKM